ncbi:hypothetical protein EVG20_g7542 [Dentipellis fragilis]|uniref:Uncharacterized protein n=1 Tax=Dentipellis fragilis TaxID=205917 RepID=A0A4Y9YF85_9AGAM|nr:hypothetical protein EVG20_g7542 [Dentipellis fragilis]
MDLRSGRRPVLANGGTAPDGRSTDSEASFCPSAPLPALSFAPSCSASQRRCAWSALRVQIYGDREITRGSRGKTCAIVGLLCLGKETSPSFAGSCSASREPRQPLQLLHCQIPRAVTYGLTTRNPFAQRPLHEASSAIGHSLLLPVRQQGQVYDEHDGFRSRRRSCPAMDLSARRSQAHTNNVCSYLRNAILAAHVTDGSLEEPSLGLHQVNPYAHFERQPPGSVRPKSPTSAQVGNPWCASLHMEGWEVPSGATSILSESASPRSKILQVTSTTQKRVTEAIEREKECASASGTRKKHALDDTTYLLKSKSVIISRQAHNADGCRSPVMISYGMVTLTSNRPNAKQFRFLARGGCNKCCSPPNYLHINTKKECPPSVQASTCKVLVRRIRYDASRSLGGKKEVRRTHLVAGHGADGRQAGGADGCRSSFCAHVKGRSHEESSLGLQVKPNASFQRQSPRSVRPKSPNSAQVGNVWCACIYRLHMQVSAVKGCSQVMRAVNPDRWLVQMDAAAIARLGLYGSTINVAAGSPNSTLLLPASSASNSPMSKREKEMRIRWWGALEDCLRRRYFYPISKSATLTGGRRRCSTVSYSYARGGCNKRCSPPHCINIPSVRIMIKNSLPPSVQAHQIKFQKPTYRVWRTRPTPNPCTVILGYLSFLLPLLLSLLISPISPLIAAALWIGLALGCALLWFRRCTGVVSVFRIVPPPVSSSGAGAMHVVDPDPVYTYKYYVASTS